MEYTEYEQAVRLWDREQVKDLLARRAYYLSGDRRAEELQELWVQDYYHRQTASLGSNWGFYTGMAEIRRFYVEEHQKLLLSRAQENGTEPGVGDTVYHTLNTGHIQIAKDGQTARALFYDMGLDAHRQKDCTTKAFVNLGPVAVDCIKENGLWKIWHLFYGYDHCLPVAGDYSAVPVNYRPGTHPYEAEFGTPTVPMRTYNPDFGWSSDFVWYPKPYGSFNALRSYGPEGHPDFKEDA